MLQNVTRLRQHPWGTAFGAAGLLLIVLHLAGLGTAPPGLYNDEASIGYNAWAIAHHGVDEHGARFPLFFEAFGEYKSAIYIYALAPLTWVLPLTPWVVRLPAAFSGLGIAAMVALTAWRLTASRPVALVMLLIAGLEPWSFLQSRVAFEPIVMVLELSVAMYALSRARGPHDWAPFAVAGGAVGVTMFTYSTGRLFAGMLVCVIVVAHGGRRDWWRSLGALVVPVAVAYGILLLWSSAHPGALLARYSALSVGADGATVPVQAGRVIVNYLQYFGVPFLFAHGDAILRHSTGWGGMLMVTSLPILLVGVVACARRRHEPIHRVALLGLLAAPIPAALTAENTPHSLRAATMLPFLFVIMIAGCEVLLPMLAMRRTLAVAGIIVVAACYGQYVEDLYIEYPGRSLTAWDVGEGPTIARAHALADGNPVLISSSLDQPYIQALFYLRGDPTAFATRGAASLGMVVEAPTDIAANARPGNLIVLGADDSPPPHATLVDTDTETVTHHDYEVARPGVETLTLVAVYRITG